MGRDRKVIERIHGERNEEDEKVVDMAVLNTFYKKQDNQTWTFCSGGRKSQIDFIMCRRKHLKEIKNFKVINGESVAPQNRQIVIGYEKGEE